MNIEHETSKYYDVDDNDDNKQTIELFARAYDAFDRAFTRTHETRTHTRSTHHSCT
jgi:hypothetical protein